MTKDDLVPLAIAFYISVSVITFGHCLNNERIEPMAHAGGVDFAATALWPFYWSWEIQK